MKRRILIDGTSARRGGGFTYMLNVLPRLSALAPESRFLVALRNERLASELAAGPNLELLALPEANLVERVHQEVT